MSLDTKHRRFIQLKTFSMGSESLLPGEEAVVAAGDIYGGIVCSDSSNIRHSRVKSKESIGFFVEGRKINVVDCFIKTRWMYDQKSRLVSSVYGWM